MASPQTDQPLNVVWQNNCSLVMMQEVQWVWKCRLGFNITKDRQIFGIQKRYYGVKM